MGQQLQQAVVVLLGAVLQIPQQGMANAKGQEKFGRVRFGTRFRDAVAPSVAPILDLCLCPKVLVLKFMAILLSLGRIP